MNYELVKTSGSQFSRNSCRDSERLDSVWTVFAGAALVSFCLLFTADRSHAAGDQFERIAATKLNPSFRLSPQSPGFFPLSGEDEYGRRRAAFDLQAFVTLNDIAKSLDTAAAPVVGAASWYNPYISDSSELESGETETSSGEQYDPDKWTAAIQIDSRDQFGGVRYGTTYLPTYALVEYGDKQEIVKINDVGPLKPGRIIDLSERAMRYFDPSLEIGLLGTVKVTPLPGHNWKAGPVAREHVPPRWVGPTYSDEMQFKEAAASIPQSSLVN